MPTNISHVTSSRERHRWRQFMFVGNFVYLVDCPGKTLAGLEVVEEIVTHFRRTIGLSSDEVGYFYKAEENRCELQESN